MTIVMTLEDRDRLPLHERVLPLVSVAASQVLTRKMNPAQLERLLNRISRGAAPATFEEAADARRRVVAVSERCAGQYCLERSVAAALYLRTKKKWATWVSGVCLVPFAAHAWLEVDGQPVAEPLNLTDFQKNLIVSPHIDRRDAEGKKP